LRPNTPLATVRLGVLSRIAARGIGLVGLVLVTCAPVSAQELEPKAYSASPVGATFFVSSLARSSGSVVFDPSLPITDVDATINAAFFGIGTTFDMFGKLALVSAAVPYAWGDVSGRVFEEAQTVTRSGLADTRVRLSVNLRGNDAVHLREFVKAPRKPIVGTSVTVLVPTGEYDRTKLINLGNNRWAFKPEVGVAVPKGRWDIDAYAGVWLFTANDDFFPGGLERTQDPVVAIQAHVSYTFKPRLWLAVDSTWYSGGSAQVAGGEPGAAVNNSRLGATLSIPASRQQSFKIAYSNGVSVRTGTDFSTVAVGWQWLWFRK
jgi:Putative MetA-pathway of phenol degradation